VVAVGDHQQVETAPLPSLVEDLPAALVEAIRADHAVAELDVVEQSEGVGVGVQVVLDVRVVREGGKVFRHREVLERQPLPGGVDVQ
jgi:hypothetical protein